MTEMISYDQQLQSIVKVTALPASQPPDREMAMAVLEASTPGFVLWLALEHVMELAHALQRAEVLKRERAAQEPVTVGPELADEVRQRAECDAEGCTS